MEESPQLFSTLRGIWNFYYGGGRLQEACEVGGQLISLASRLRYPALLLEAHRGLGTPLFTLGEFSRAREHLEQSLALYDPQQHGSLAFLFGFEPGAFSFAWAAFTWWVLGYPDQALEQSQEALTRAQQGAHSYTRVAILSFSALLRQLRRERQAAHEQAEAAMTFATGQEFPLPGSLATGLRGWALAEQGHLDEGIALMCQGLAAWRGTGAEVLQSPFLILLAEMYGKGGQTEQGLTVLTETLVHIDQIGERWGEAELYRVQGELTLELKVQGGGV